MEPSIDLKWTDSSKMRPTDIKLFNKKLFMFSDTWFQSIFKYFSLALNIHDLNCKVLLEKNFNK